jgi:hypothetical protein
MLWLSVPTWAQTFYGGTCGAGGLTCASNSAADLCNRSMDYADTQNPGAYSQSKPVIPDPNYPTNLGTCSWHSTTNGSPWVTAHVITTTCSGTCQTIAPVVQTNAQAFYGPVDANSPDTIEFTPLLPGTVVEADSGSGATISGIQITGPVGCSSSCITPINGTSVTGGYAANTANKLTLGTQYKVAVSYSVASGQAGNYSVSISGLPSWTAWTPTLYINGSATGITYSGTNFGLYQVSGNKVDINFCVSLTSKGTGTGDVTMSLPLPVGSSPSSGNGSELTYWSMASGFAGPITINAISGGSIANLYTPGPNWVTNASLTNSSQFCGNATYYQ